MGKAFVVLGWVAAGLNIVLFIPGVLGLFFAVLPGSLLAAMGFVIAAVLGQRRHPDALIYAVAGWLVNIAMAVFLWIVGGVYVLTWLAVTSPIYLAGTAAVVTGVLARRPRVTA